MPSACFLGGGARFRYRVGQATPVLTPRFVNTPLLAYCWHMRRSFGHRASMHATHLEAVLSVQPLKEQVAVAGLVTNISLIHWSCA